MTQIIDKLITLLVCNNLKIASEKKSTFIDEFGEHQLNSFGRNWF